MNVSEVMTENECLAERSTPLRDIAKMMKKDNCGSVPVQENDKLIGMITDRDIVVRSIAEGKDPMTMTADDVMTDDILYCYEDQSTEEVTKNMAKNAVRRLPVLNRDKRLVGIVSFADLSQGNDDAVTGEALEDIRKASEPRRKAA